MNQASNIWQGIEIGLSRSERGLTILDEEREINYAPQELIEASLGAGAVLLNAGVEPGDHVGILAQTTPSMVLAFLGCWAAGAVAVPLPLPMRAMEPQAFMEQTRLRLEKVGAVLLLLPGALIPMVGGMGEGIRMMAAEELDSGEHCPPSPAGRDDLALIQFTSGSTSEPRGVMLTHRAVLANAHAIISHLDVNREDRIVSWMPLYHDMGLIGFLLTALCSGSSLMLMSPQKFIADPSLWLRLISDYRATITGGPNFAYALAARVLRSGRLEDIELSSLRQALNGAEPVDHDAMEALIQAGSPYGLKPEVPYPVYGLAEATLAVTFPPPGRGYRLDHVLREGLEDGRAEPGVPGESATRTLVSLGSPLSGVDIAIFSSDGYEAGERDVGEVCVRGASLMEGYWADAAATAETLRGGWLHTGDLGYFADGELYLVGRIKDMVIVGGRNLFPEDVERCAEQVRGIRKGNAVAFGVTTRRGRERLVLIGETRLGTEEAERVANHVSDRVRGEIGVPVRDVVLVTAGSLPKTSSGKKRRFLCRDLYLGEKLQTVVRSGAAVIGG
ncbi:MAG: fatty acyl-AMP ligase [Actinomycetota bacterium]|nr:fatty acyl-AMP ligase [Actinomycetota bacterium]